MSNFRGVQGDVWGGGVMLTLASVQWSDVVRMPPAVKAEEEEDESCDASRSPQTCSD